MAILFNGPQLASPSVADAEPDETVDTSTDCPRDTIVHCEVCPVCGHEGRTLVCDYNKFITFRRPPDPAAAKYDYSLCHGCGVVYAASRPAGARYRWLFENFEATIGRAPSRKQSVRKLALSAFALDEDDERELRAALSRGVFVSEHERVSRKEYIPGLLGDRLAGAPHAEILSSLLDLRRARVLEIRSRSGAISAILARAHAVRPHVMALFEHQRFVIGELYGLATSAVDFEAFAVPAEGPFDLIIANHMLTHAVRPGAFLATVSNALVPGGHLYLYNEPTEGEYLSDGKSMFNTLNAFHLQAFDGPALTRALDAHGFETHFLTSHDQTFSSLSRKRPRSTGSATLSDAERNRRVALYGRARDASILMLPAAERAQFAGEWEAVVARALSEGTAVIGGEGQVRPRRRH